MVAALVPTPLLDSAVGHLLHGLLCICVHSAVWLFIFSAHVLTGLFDSSRLSHSWPANFFSGSGACLASVKRLFAADFRIVSSRLIGAPGGLAGGGQSQGWVLKVFADVLFFSESFIVSHFTCNL